MKKIFYSAPGVPAFIVLPLRRTLVRLSLYAAVCMLVLLLAVSCKNTEQQNNALVNSDIYYTCSMHPQVMQDKPGNCPICGMQLIQAKKSTAQKADEIQLSDEQIQLGNIKVDTIRNGSVGNQQVLTATLNLNEQNINVVSARVAGRVEKIYFKNTGDYISKGDHLFDIYSEDLNNAKQEYLLALDQQNMLDAALIDLKQLLESAKHKLLLWGLSEQQIQELASSRKIAVLTPYYSNASGYLTSLDIKEGDYVMEGGSIIKLADMSSLWAEAQVYASQVSSLDKNGQATVLIPDLNNKEIKGAIEFVNPEINPDTRINLLRINIPNTQNLLHPGMPVYVYLNNVAHKGLSLPVNAVLRNGNNASVWVKTAGNTFKTKMVITGVESGDYIEIRSGLEEGEAVVVSGAYLLNSEYIFKRGADPMAGMDMSNM